MSRVMSLAHPTILDADAVTLIDAAAKAGFDAVGLRLVAPPGAPPVEAVCGDIQLQRRIADRLAGTGVALLDVEAVWLVPGTDVASLRPALDTAVRLGARNIVVSGNDPDRGRTVANLAALCEASHERGLRVMLEFIPYTHVSTLRAAFDVLTAAAPVDAGLLVDALHLTRSGGSAADLSGYDPALFSYVHLCDAPGLPPTHADLRTEARTGRLLPGHGGLPLQAFMAAFPDTIPVAIEAPSARGDQTTAVARAQAALRAVRSLLAANA